MDAVLILWTKVRRSLESKAGIVGRITQDNNSFIASLPAPLDAFESIFVVGASHK